MRARKNELRVPIGIAFVGLVAAFAFFLYRHPSLIERVQEDITFRYNPTADRAFEYGMRHINALDPQEYDMDRAEYFFFQSEEINSNYPMVHYQLARIAFLKNNFPLALSLVDTEFYVNPKPDASVYYVRALIEGYMGDYVYAAKDYETYFKIHPANWAAINDYSWVLLKMNLPLDAHNTLSWGLKQWPLNAWLLTNDATALYELGRYSEAAVVAKKAIPAVQALTVGDWLIAYPGNDPQIALTGLDNFKQSSQENLTKILAKTK